MQCCYSNLSLKTTVNSLILKTCPSFFLCSKTVQTSNFSCLISESTPSLLSSSTSTSTSVSPHFANAPNHSAAFPTNSLLLLRLQPGFSALISLPLPQYGIFWMVAGMKRYWKEGVSGCRAHDCSAGSNSSSSTFSVFTFLCGSPSKEGTGEESYWFR